MPNYEYKTQIIRNTKAEKDQDHIHILTDCNTNIPDRTGAILGNGEDPLPQMRTSAKLLERMGADLLIMPCNTAHYFYDGICDAVQLPVLHMPRETARYLKERGLGKAAVFATDGTVRAGVYDRALREQEIEPVYPDREGQELLMTMIYAYVKAGKTDLSPIRTQTEALIEKMKAAGAQRMILGCTELPIAFTCLGLEEGTADPTRILARAAVRAAGYELTEN